MRAMWKIAIILGVCLIAADIAEAQPGGQRGGRQRGGAGGRGGFGGGIGGGRGQQRDALSLLRNDAVKKELKLTEAQEKKIPDAIQSALKNTLEPGQYKRLEQIQLQLRGSAALRDETIQTKLGFSASQKDDLKTLYADYDKESKALLGGGGGAGGRGRGGFNREAFTKIAAMRKEVEEKTMSVLTDSQKKIWTDMTGAKFEMPQRGRGGFGRGTGGRPGAGGQPGRRGAGGNRGRPGGGGATPPPATRNDTF